MSNDSPPDKIHYLKYYKAGDLSHGWQYEQFEEVVSRSDQQLLVVDVVSALEYHNALTFLSSGEVYNSFGRDDTHRRDISRRLEALASRYFEQLTENSIHRAFQDLPYQYQADLLERLSRHRIFRRCAADVMLSTLRDAGIGLATIVTFPEVAKRYDAEVRDLFLSSPRNAELLIKKYFEAGQDNELTYRLRYRRSIKDLSSKHTLTVLNSTRLICSLLARFTQSSRTAPRVGRQIAWQGRVCGPVEEGGPPPSASPSAN